jgi:hypothetical protein
MNSKSSNSSRTEQESNPQDKFIEVSWIARKLRPTILVYVLLIFATLMAVSLFVFQSTNALKSLAMAAVASAVALLPQVLSKIEYQANESGLGTRPHGKAGNQDFRLIFLWNELDHARFVKQGFKYIRNLDEKSPAKRFLKRQFSDKYSGEIRVDAEDRDRVYELLTERGVAIRRH